MTNGIKEFLVKHGLQIFILILTGFGIVMVYQTKVDGNTQGIEINAQEIKRVDAKYPSEDWFNLKFKTIEKDLIRLENKIDGKATRF